MVVFFFQAEDGIRDLVRSRGLGDVYKRQPGAFGGQGGWKPEETRAADVVPTYRWFDGTSEVYVLGQSPTLNANGEYEFGVPLGLSLIHI